MVISNVLIILESFRCAGHSFTIPALPEQFAEGLPADLADPECAVMD